MGLLKELEFGNVLREYGGEEGFVFRIENIHSYRLF